MKLISWNVNGLRAIYKKGFEDFSREQAPDILCLQETKIGREQEELFPPCADIYSPYSSGASKKGYSGVATYVKNSIKHNKSKITYGLGVEKFDSEGRFIITHHDNFKLYNVYFPSGTTGDVRQVVKYDFLDTFYKHLQSLTRTSRDKLIICGDFNICHKEIDIHHPKQAEKRGLSGFLPDERKWMDKFVDLGFVDVFRLINGPVKDSYSWWSYRAGARGKNLGWRIDYFFVSKALSKCVTDAQILSNVTGSDHCPITLDIDV